MRKLFPLFLIFLLFGIVGSADAGTIEPLLEETLLFLGPDDEVPIIINLSDKAAIDLIKDKDKHTRRSKIVKALKDKADTTQRPLKLFLEGKKAKGIKPFWIINGIAAIVPAYFVSELSGFPGVESVTLDAAIEVPPVTIGTLAAPEWNMSAIKAPEVWNLGYTGAGVVVANMDTGVDLEHPDLKSKWRGGASSWYDPFKNTTSPYDVNGHGTATMGIMVGGSAGGTAIGAAPGAKWIAAKIFPDTGSSSISYLHSAFQWLLNPDMNSGTNDAPDIVNASWAFTDSAGQCIVEVQPDILALKAAGIAVSFAAGNDGPNSSTSNSPANNIGSFSVGATDVTDTIAWFSSRGPAPLSLLSPPLPPGCNGGVFPRVVAPGVNIRLADLSLGGSANYAYGDGTSFSSPHVAGGMALLSSAFPAGTPSQLESALEQTAADLGIQGPDHEYGYGLIDVQAAFDALLVLNPYTITATAGSGGSISPGTVHAGPGATVMLSVTPSNGYHIESVTGCGGTLSGNTFTTGVITGDCAVNAIFASFAAVTLITPNGGEVIPSGSLYTIRWGAPASAVRFRLQYSLNNGGIWITIASNITGASFNWTVPRPSNNSPNCLMRVTGYNSSGAAVGKDATNAVFTIQVVKVTSPDGGETLTRGVKYPITWTTNGTVRPVASTRLQYSANGGATWITIATLPGNPGTYNWKAPAVTTAAAKVRVILRDSGTATIGSDDSNNFFTIKP